MAITDAGKLFESTATTRVHTLSLGLSCKAGSILAVYVTAYKLGTTMSVSSATDSKGNVWQVEQIAGASCAAIVWTRTSVAMTTADTVTITLNQTPTYAWKSGHNFEGAAEDAYDVATAAGTSTDIYATVAVTGSDWLALGCAIIHIGSVPTTTEVDSSISQDTTATGGPYSEGWSRNGTTGTEQRIGATIASAYYRRAIGITLLAGALNTARANPQTLIGFL